MYFHPVSRTGDGVCIFGDIHISAAASVIGRDGEVGDLDVLQGRCIFVEPAAAIQKRRYQPTVFNGSPVGVDTTITVKFSLKR